MKSSAVMAMSIHDITAVASLMDLKTISIKVARAIHQSRPRVLYWRVYYQNAEGHEAIQDWFEGFRHGASVARASGVRDFVVIPLSSMPPREILTDEAPPADPFPTDERKGQVPQTEKMGPFQEELPNKPNEKEGPVKPPITPPKTANGKPMPPPAPLIQVERMIAPPIPNKPNNP